MLRVCFFTLYFYISWRVLYAMTIFLKLVIKQISCLVCSIITPVSLCVSYLQILAIHNPTCVLSHIDSGCLAKTIMRKCNEVCKVSSKNVISLHLVKLIMKSSDSKMCTNNLCTVNTTQVFSDELQLLYL